MPVIDGVRLWLQVRLRLRGRLVPQPLDDLEAEVAGVRKFLLGERHPVVDAFVKSPPA